MQQIADEHGSVCVAWVAPAVLYARFNNRISTRVGQRFAARLLALLPQFESLHYFADSRHLKEYDILARSAIVRATLANKHRFASFVVLSWNRGVGNTARTIADAFGQSIEYLTDANEFESRLFALAPSARDVIDEAPATTRKAPRA